MNFTFKTERPKGKYAWTHPSTHYIKFNKKIVGQIYERNNFQIGLMIWKDIKHTDNNPNCEWMWIFLKYKFNSLNEAKAYLKENCDRIISTYNLRMGE